MTVKLTNVRLGTLKNNRCLVTGLYGDDFGGSTVLLRPQFVLMHTNSYAEMRALTLQKVDVAHRDQQQQQQQQQAASCGRSLSSNYAPLSLENKLLTQSSLMMTQPSSLLLTSAARPSPCTSLQPSSLSSTSSRLLSSFGSSPSFISPLLSTQNKLLTSDSSRISLSLTSSVPDGSLLSTKMASGALVSHFAHPPSFMHHGPGGEQKMDVGGDEAVQSCAEETSVHSEEDDVSEEEEEQAVDAGLAVALSALETEDLDQTVDVRQEEFAEFDAGNDTIEEEVKDKKYHLLNVVCCSLVNKSSAPGQKDWDTEDSVWTRIINLAKDVSAHDPQFLLKLAIYTRQELNIRITANFLLAVAANQPNTKPHVRRYFCAAVQLPSDWLEVVRIYSTCFSRSLPMCLKKAMADKFKEFNEYQLAKYNTRKHRCKHNRNRRKNKKPDDQQLKQWANLLRSDASILTKFLQVESKTVVDKKQSEFSIKKLIKRLHIKEPAHHVMAILGKKYPADAKAFIHSGMKGEWDRERAGKRMRLKEPETWERLLSLQGNKAATWERLIDNKSLPFMAMLRNLRNMITQGISERHHNKILSRLTNQKAVIQSRQFPFRFLAAYKVVMELQSLASVPAIPPATEILKGILKKIPKSKRFKSLEWETTKRGRVRVALGVPFVYRQYRLKKAQLLKASQRLYTSDLLDRYRKALETAVQISCCYNVPPLPGQTAIILPCGIEGDRSWRKKQDFCLPPDPEEEEEEEEEEKEKEEEEEENIKEEVKEKENMEEEEEEEENIEEEEKEKENMEQEEEEVRSRKKKKKEEDKLTPSMEETAVLLSLMISSSAEDSRLFLTWGDSIREVQLKSNVLLENVRNVMKQIKKLKEASDSEDDESQNNFFTPFTKKNKYDNIIMMADSWISSDMEYTINNYRKEVNNKALLVEIYMSERYCRGSGNFLDRNKVQLEGFSEQTLRFVAERGSSRLLEHVEHLDKLYNIPPPKDAKSPETSSSVIPIPAGPKLRWRGVRVFISSTFRDMHAERDVLVRSVFPELRRRAAVHRLYLQEVELRWGVTEEESGRATELCLSEVCRSQMMVGILGERYGLVPPQPVLPQLPQYSWLASAPAGLSITEMEIRQFQALFPDAAQERMFCYFRDPNITNYPCEWGGVVDGKPYLKNLEDFSKAVLEDLWMAVQKQFVEEDEEAEAASDLTEQEVHQGALQRQFFGRAKLLSGAMEMVEQVQTKGGMMVVEGGPGEGKTVFMAALADALRTGVKSRRNLVCDVISYSTAASQSACSVENLVRCLVQWFRKMKDTEEESPLPHFYKDLLSEFHSTLSEMKRNKPLVLMVDGVDAVQDGRGQLNSDWIPQQLPQGVCLVVSLTSKAMLLQTLTKRRSAVLFTLGQLTVPDRREIVQKGLDSFGKKLSDSAFNNQLQTLIMKKGAVSPLYLHLACEDLRSFASFDKLNESLKDLPQSLSQLVQHSLDRLCSQYRGMLGLHWMLAALSVSSTGLRERDLYSLLNACNDLSSRDGQVSWQEVLKLSRKPKGRTPMATFTRIVQSLRSLIGPSHSHDTDDLLALTNPEVRRAFEDFVLPEKNHRTRAHLVLAAHLWAVADPQGTDTFLHCEASSVMHLPSNLIQSGQLEALHSLLSSYYFLYANVRHGLVHHLLETYSLYSECQALNEPPDTCAHTWAQGLVGKGGVRVVEWLNNKDHAVEKTSELVSTVSSEPTCLVLSPDGEMMVVGTGEGMLHFINTQTGQQQVKSLVSSCDGISSCVFLKDGRLVTTSFDGRIEMWDTVNGCRTALIDGHTNIITGSDISADHKHLATVSLDFKLKVWSSAKGHEVAALFSSSPLNCVTFDPEDRLLAAGCWNGEVIVWNWLQNKTQTPLSGHQCSVRSLSFSSSSSSMLCSGSISGEVRVWSVPTSTCLGCFQAHCGAAEVLTFLDEGRMLLSGGSDQLCEQEPPQKRLKSVNSALCVAVNGDHVAVGYHGKESKTSALTQVCEMTWASSEYDMSILCLLWVVLDAEKTEAELLVSGGTDKRLRVWKREEGEEGERGRLKASGMFAAQRGSILALAQNATYLASASEDFTVALWTLSELAADTDILPHAVLRGHTGGVTCLAFSPDGGQLLSGGKDQALIVWDVKSSPAALSKSLPHSHRDWITGCVWTPDCVISSSDDGRLCLWDLQAGQRLREISWRSALTSICCLGPYVMAGCADGVLHVWNWENNMEICHIAAHKQRVNHCSLLKSTDKNTKVNPEDMTVFTASDDSTVHLWKPLQMEHFSTFPGHSGAIHGVARKRGVTEFLTVSEDCSVRCWTWTTKSPLSFSGPVSAVCFLQKDDLCVVGYTSGLLELWQRNTVVGRKQVSGSTISAICTMPHDQFAVGYNDASVVDVWKLVWNQQHSTASLMKVTTDTVKAPVIYLFYCSTLICVSNSGSIFETGATENKWRQQANNWNFKVQPLGWIRNDEKSVWLVGDGNGHAHIGFLAHSDKISVLRLTDSTIISASYDRTVKLWDRVTKKQVGMFVCSGPVQVLEVNPQKPSELVCGDGQGKVYFLSWKD
ncbi:hypothetical protein INR49_031318 [Caranx melampygus]|nr:hypothetical protein INR49_031318 [Caranx melampygus]